MVHLSRCGSSLGRSMQLMHVPGYAFHLFSLDAYTEWWLCLGSSHGLVCTEASCHVSSVALQPVVYKQRSRAFPLPFHCHDPVVHNLLLQAYYFAIVSSHQINATRACSDHFLSNRSPTSSSDSFGCSISPSAAPTSSGAPSSPAYSRCSDDFSGTSVRSPPDLALTNY